MRAGSSGSSGSSCGESPACVVLVLAAAAGRRATTSYKQLSRARPSSGPVNAWRLADTL